MDVPEGEELKVMEAEKPRYSPYSAEGPERGGVTSVESSSLLEPCPFHL